MEATDGKIGSVDEATFKEPTYRDTVGEYYGRFPFGAGPGGTY
ncbi:hypothetical protein AB0J63_43870 [Streptosporangium canum]